MSAPDRVALRVTVVYCRPEVQWEREVIMAAGATVGDAVDASGLRAAFSELAAGPLDVGVFGRCCGLERPLEEGDRVEVYRPLRVDPKEARRARANARRSSGRAR